MLKSLFVVLALVTPALADEAAPISGKPESEGTSTKAPPPLPAVPLTPQDFQTWGQVNIAMSQCVGAMTLGSDASVCKFLQSYLGVFAQRVHAAAPAPPGE